MRLLVEIPNIRYFICDIYRLYLHSLYIAYYFCEKYKTFITYEKLLFRIVSYFTLLHIRIVVNFLEYRIYDEMV